MPLSPDEKASVRERLAGFQAGPVTRSSRDDGQAEGFLGDTYRGLTTGVQRLPGIAAGIGDIGAGLAGGAVRGAATALGASEGAVGAIERFYDRPFSRAADWAGERTGFTPGEWADAGAERYSPQMQDALAVTQRATQENITDRWEAGDKWGAVRGIAPTALEYIKQPRSVQALVTESLPMTFAGGFVGAGARAGLGTKMVMDKTAQKALTALGPANQTAVRSAHRMSAPVAAGIGEGAVIGGVVMSEIDPEVDAARAALASLGAGVFGGAIGGGGAALAGSRGFIDIDAAIAGRSLSAGIKEGGKPRSWPTRIAGGALFEGLQEVPQESMEQIAQNWAEGEPLFNGVLETVAPAFLAGGAMGAGVNILNPRGGADREFDLDDQRLFGADLQKRTPDEPAPTSGQELLKDRTTAQLEAVYQQAMGLVQNAPTDNETAQQAFTMLGDIRAELQSRGVTDEMLDLETAQARYAQLQMQIPATLERYQQALKSGDVEKAQKIYGNIQKLRGEFTEIHTKWGKQAESQTAVILRWARANMGDTAADKIKKMVTPKGQLNTAAHLQIENAKKLGDAELAWRAENKGDTVKDIAAAWVADVRFSERTAEERTDLAASFKAQRTAGRTRKGKAAPASEESTNRTYIKQVEDRAKRAVDEGRVTPEVAQAAVDKERTRLGMEPSKPVIKQDTPTDLTSFVAQDTTVGEQQGALPVTDEQQSGTGRMQYTVETDPVTGKRVFRRAQLTQTYAAEEAAEEATTPAVSQARKVNEATMQIRGSVALEGKEAVTPAARQDYEALFQVIQEIASGQLPADTNIRKEIARRFPNAETGKPRSQRTVGENIQNAFNTLLTAGGREELVNRAQNLRKQAKQLRAQAAEKGIDETEKALLLRQAATLSSMADETKLDRIVARVAASMEATGQVDSGAAQVAEFETLSQMLDESEQAEFTAGETLEGEGLVEAAAFQGNLTMINAAGGGSAGTDVTPAQLNKKRDHVKNLDRQFQELQGKLAAAVREGNRTRAASLEKALEDVYAKREKAVAELEELGETFDEVDTLAAEEAEARAVEEAAENQRMHDASLRASAAEAADLYLSAVGRAAGQLWDSIRGPGEPSWGDMQSDLTAADPWIAAYSYFRVDGNRTIRFRGEILEEQQALPMVQAAVIEEMQNADNIKITLEQGVAALQETQNEAATDTGQAVQQQQRGGTARDARDPIRERAADTGTVRNAQDQAASQEEVTPDAAPIRENARRPAESGGATQEGQANRRRDVQQNAQAQREAGDAQVGDVLRPAKGGVYTEKGARGAQTSKRKANVETAIEPEGKGFVLRVVEAPTEADLSARIDQVRELAGQLNSQTRKRYDTMVMQIVGDKKLGLRERLTAYDHLIDRLTNAVRGQKANRVGADAFAAQQADQQTEATPGVTPETNAQLDRQAAGTDTDARWYILDGAAQDYLTGANARADVFLAHADAKKLIKAEGYLDNLEAIDTALTALADAITRAQANQPDAQTGIAPRAAAQGMSIEAVYNQIRREFGDLPGVASHITVFDTLDGLPDAVIERVRQQLAKGNSVRGVFYNNHVYLHAPSLQSDRSVRGIVMHEVGVHFALTGRTPQRMENLAAEVVNWWRSAMAKDELYWTQEERLAMAAVQAVQKAAKGGPQGIDELVAYFVDVAVLSGIDPTNLGNIPRGPLRQWFDALMKTINEAIAKIDSFFAGTSDVAVTAQDVVDLTFGMAQWELAKPRAPNVIAPAPKSGVDALIQQMPKSTQWWWKDLQGKLLKAAGVTSFSREIVDWSGRLGLTAAKRYFNMLTGKIAIRSEYLAQIQHIVAPTRKWDRKHRKVFNDFLYFSAYREEWGFEPTWLETSNYDPNSDVAKAFETMLAKFPENQRETVRKTAIAMFQHAHVMHSNLQKHMRSEIESSYTRLIAAAKTPNQRKVQEAERDAALRDFDTKQQGFRNAYLPLRRWGEWAVVYKSPQLREAEAAKDRTRIRQLKGDFKHYVVLFEENERTALATREKFQTLLRRETGDQTIEFPEPFPRERQREMLNEEIPFDMINKLKQQVDLGPDVSQSVKSSIMNALDRMYITALSEASSRKSELERMSVSGANDDMIRAFIEQGTGVAALAAALDTNAGTRELIQEMKDQAHDSSKPHRRERMMALNELLARHAQALEYTDHPVIAQIMGTTSVWMLMSNPAYYIQNATQPFMLTFPWLAGEFGAAKTMARMTQAYPRILKLYRATKDGSLLDPQLLDSIENDPSLRQLFEDLQMRGLLDVGIAMELGSFKDAKTKAGRTVNFVHTKMVGAVRTVELFNRGVTAMVAYELKLAKLRKANPQVALEKHQADAREFAMDAVAQTQGDYSGVNAPRLISMIPAGKLMTQFRKFQLIQIGLLTRVMYQSFKGANPAERKLARAQFGYLMMMHGTVGGMLGLPIPMVMWWAVAHAFGDEDEPANIEMLLRREIGNKEVADLLLRGLPAYMGVDASNRLGMGMTFSLLPFTDIKPTRDGALVVIASALGPWTTPLARGVDGIGQMRNGNVLAGIAQMQPALTMNLIRAYEQHTVGVRSRQGVTLLAPEELGYLELVTQGLGWPNKTLTDRHLIAGMKWETTEHFKGRAIRIRKAYADAYRDGDSAKMNRAMDEWVRLQEMKTRYGLGNFLPLKDLTKAPLERMKKEQQVIGGVQFESTERGFVEDMFM